MLYEWFCLCLFSVVIVFYIGFVLLCKGVKRVIIWNYWVECLELKLV